MEGHLVCTVSAVCSHRHSSPFWAWACCEIVSHTLLSEAGLPFLAKVFVKVSKYLDVVLRYSGYCKG